MKSLKGTIDGAADTGTGMDIATRIWKEVVSTDDGVDGAKQHFFGYHNLSVCL